MQASRALAAAAGRDVTNWTVTQSGSPATVTAADVVGGVVQLTLALPPLGPTDITVTYSPPPYDIEDTSGFALQPGSVTFTPTTP